MYENPQIVAPLHWNAQDWHKITREISALADAASVQIIAGVKPVTGSTWIDNLAWIESPEVDSPFEGALQIEGDHAIQRGVIDGLQVSDSYTPYSDHIAINTKITDSTGEPRARDVSWGLPIALTPNPSPKARLRRPTERGDEGWSWWDGLREKRPLNSNQDYSRSVSADIAGYLPISLNPYTLIEDDRQGLSLALPLDSPRYMLMQYDGTSGRYEGRAHLGISPEAQKLSGGADFTLLLYQTDPTGGLRAAADKHAQIGPHWYDTAADFSGYTDFTREHFSAKGKGAARLQELNSSAVYAAQYMVYELSINMLDENNPRPSYTESWQFLGELAEGNSNRASYPSSVICDAANEPHLKLISVTPWSGNRWNAIWIPSMDPNLSGGFGSYKLLELANLFTDTDQAGLTLDGIFIDNFISTSTMDLCPEHLAAADIPLTYDPNTYQPATHTASAGWEFLIELRSLLDKQPEPYRSISINFWAMNIPTLLAPYIDAFGGEGASAKGSNWTPVVPIGPQKQKRS